MQQGPGETPEPTITPCEACAALVAARTEGLGGFVAELHTGLLLLHPDQTQKGRLRFVLKSHQDRVLMMPKATREGFWRDFELMIEVVREALQPVQLNVSGPSTGNADAHEVWELVPRYAEEPHAEFPHWTLADISVRQESVSAEVLTELRRRLLRGFLTVAPVRRETPPQKMRRRY